MRERAWERARECTSMSECTYTGIKVGLERWLAALTYDPGSVPSTHMAAYKNFNPTFREPDALFWPLQALHVHGTQMQRRHTYKEKILLCGCRNPNAGPHDCATRTYTAQPSLQSSILILICNLKIHIFLISVYACLSHVCKCLCRRRRTSDPLELEL